MRNSNLIILSTVLVAVVLLSPPASNGQAMISYGHGVAKAGAAGSAVGAAAVGIFRNSGRPLDDAAKKSSARARRAPAGRSQENVRWDAGSPYGGSSLRLAGGVSAAGVSAPNWTPALVESAEHLTVLGAEWSGGPEETPEGAASETGPTATADTALAGVPSAGRSPDAIVLAAHGPQATQHPVPSSAAAPAPAAAVTLPVEAGMSLEEVFEKLGDPKFSFVGVAGSGYTDQFLFELEDGRRIVVYAINGLVSRIVTDD